MGEDSDEIPEPRYTVIESDVARAERDEVFTYLLPLVGPKAAGDWYDGLSAAVAGLADFPGPLSHPIDQEATEHFGYEVRRCLYRGPKRRANFGYRILFTILPPSAADDETVLRVIRILHTARTLSAGGEEA